MMEQCARRACRLQHGCLTKAIRVLLRPHRAEACLSVRGWICLCIRGEKNRDRERVSCIFNADKSVPGCGTRWPSLASDSSGHCPGKLLSADSCTKTCIYTRINLTLPPSQCFSFQFLPEKTFSHSHFGL